MRRQIISTGYPGQQSLPRYDHNQLQALRYDDMQSPTGYPDKGAVTLLHHTYTHERRQANSEWIPRQRNLQLALTCQHYGEKQTSPCRTLWSALRHISGRAATLPRATRVIFASWIRVFSHVFPLFPPLIFALFPPTSTCAVRTKPANESCTRTHEFTRQSAARIWVLSKVLGTKKITRQSALRKQTVFV